MRDYPAVPAYQVELGACHCNSAVLLRDAVRPADSLEWFDKAIQILAKVLEQQLRDVTVRRSLGGSYGNRADALDQLGKHAEAIRDWDKAVEISPASEQAAYRAYRADSRVRGTHRRSHPRGRRAVDP
jgi:tetratricopeptide (TPR) repeat protein